MRFPSLTELCYEPWRERGGKETQSDQYNQTMLESLAEIDLSKLTTLEISTSHTREAYTTAPPMAQGAESSHKPQTRNSVSLMKDASYFQQASKGSHSQWENLTRLALTSSVLTADAHAAAIDDMLRDAAAAALKTPKLETVEL
ncbi:hypothetical protein CORC01_01369 [Colletotrichum orchidophilum]|uniref:DUF6546 domain-containing protein n=1 Tax=Colletotrichum orchidophilum TaxID=1209926 RepID=A0A1G4BPW1_9PEZI|nr:uncharacterized protein CORC01_01369 [Colletotrichum orchidophilum]OHF03316.1 hypothetical protein CORC01_01369 [Colletotrichum orchidophilum]